MVAAGGRQFEYSFMDYSPESSPERENGPDNGFDFLEFSREHEPDRVSIRVWKIFIHLTSDIVAVKQDSSILKESSNPVCGFSMMEQVRLCAVWSTENWLGSSMNHIQGWMTV